MAAPGQQASTGTECPVLAKRKQELEGRERERENGHSDDCFRPWDASPKDKDKDKEGWEKSWMVGRHTAQLQHAEGGTFWGRHPGARSSGCDHHGEMATASPAQR